MVGGREPCNKAQRALWCPKMYQLLWLLLIRDVLLSSLLLGGELCHSDTCNPLKNYNIISHNCNIILNIVFQQFSDLTVTILILQCEML